MKLKFGFGFNGGHLEAECDTFEDADKVIDYALKRGIVTITVPTPSGPVEVDITSNETIKKAAKGKAKAEATTVNETPAILAADAAQAVKDYAAKHGVEAGRALLAKFNLKRTNEINDDNAAEIYAAAKE